MQRPVDGNAERSDDGSGKHGSEGLTCSVEGAGIDGLSCPECERWREDGEVGCSGGGISGSEGAVAEDQIDAGFGKSNHGCRAKKREGYQAGDGAVDGGGEFAELPATEE